MSLRRASQQPVSHRIVDRTLVIDLGRRCRVLSSAPHGGGLRATRYVLNHQVPSHPQTQETPHTRWPSPSVTLRALARTLHVDPASVGLMTAVPMTQLVRTRLRSGALWVDCFATVGVTNAVRAGDWPVPAPASKGGQVGTINLIVITNVRITPSAMVGAVQVITESKTGVLRDHRVRTQTGSQGATGTGTDAVVLVCGVDGVGPYERYSGMHTELGAMLARAAALSVAEGLVREARWRATQAWRLRQKRSPSQ